MNEEVEEISSSSSGNDVDASVFCRYYDAVSNPNPNPSADPKEAQRARELRLRENFSKVI